LPSGAGEKKMNIYAGNIPRETSETEIRDAFEKYGQVTSVTMIKDKFTNMFKGFCFIEMPNKEEAEKAIKNLDGAMFGGRALSVNPAKPKTESGNSQKRFGNRRY
jgi:RNA recognition motif-containing protein